MLEQTIKVAFFLYFCKPFLFIIMERLIYNKFDKSSIARLPRAVFGGRIVVITTAKEADKAVNFLLSQKIVGIDTETRPSFKKGQSRLVALLQVATLDICFLFRLNLTGFTPAIVKFLEDKSVMKIGLSLHDDILSLHKRGEFKPENMIDLQNVVGEVGIKDLSLQKIYANIFNEKISKTAQLSNWEADILTDSQKLYAATDAWACVMIYNELERLMRERCYKLVEVPDNEQTTDEQLETKEQNV